MKKFLKKLTERAAVTAFNIFKDKKIQEARNKTADAFNLAVEKAALSIKAYVVLLMVASGFCSAGIVLLVLGVVLKILSGEFNDSASGAVSLAFWTMIGSGGIMILLPLFIYRFMDLEKRFRKDFADDFEKKIRGR